MKLFKVLLIAGMLLLTAPMKGQTVAVKSNVLDDAMANINVGVEAGLAPQWTFDMPVSFNAWKFSHDRRWKHWAIQPGARYWFCNRFAGHFVGMHVHGGQYNVGGFDGKINLFGTDFRKLKNATYQGWFAGAGVSYGYAWILNRHWNFEAEIGLGWSYTRFDSYPCEHCGNKLDDNRAHNYAGITKAALNFVYVF